MGFSFFFFKSTSSHPCGMASVGEAHKQAHGFLTESSKCSAESITVTWRVFKEAERATSSITKHKMQFQTTKSLQCWFCDLDSESLGYTKKPQFLADACLMCKGLPYENFLRSVLCN